MALNGQSRERRSPSLARRRKRVNQPGVLLLGVAFMCGIALVQVLEEQDGASGLAGVGPAVAMVSGGGGQQAEADGLTEARDDRQQLLMDGALEDGGGDARGSAAAAAAGPTETLDTVGSVESGDAATAAAAAGVGPSTGNLHFGLMSAASASGDLVEFVRLSRGPGAGSGVPAVLTYSSFGYRFVLLNWILSLQRVGVKSFAVVCTDDRLRAFLLARGLPCFRIDSRALGGENGGGAGDGKQVRKRDSMAKLGGLWVLRMTHLLQLLEAGVSVVLSDSDAVWTTNAVASGLLSTRTGDLVFSRGQFPFDLHERWGATACMGLAFFAATPRVVEFVKVARAEAVMARDDQVGVNRALFKLYGVNPDGVFGRKVELHSAVDDVAPGSEGLPRLVLAAHTKIPRFCKRLSAQDWRERVQVAHCHAGEGVVAKTNSNAANAKSRNGIMLKYDLWCPQVVQSPNAPALFASWLERTSAACALVRFQKR